VTQHGTGERLLRVVILGAGFGGLEAARAMARAPVEITLIDRHNHHLFQPLLYQVATAALSPGDIAWPIRAIFRRQRNLTVVMAEVTGIDTEARVVDAGDELALPYDVLVLATGATHSYFGHDEWAPVAPGLKTIEDATDIRRRLLLAFERAEVTEDAAERRRLLTFVVVGAGPTGVEVVGQIAELADRTLTGAFRTIDPAEARVILVEAAPAVLPPMGPKLGLKAQRRLEKMGVEVKLNTMVTDVDYMGLTVKPKDGEEYRIECAVKVWSAGVQASPLGKQIAEQSDGTEVDRAGRVVVEPDLTVKGHPNVFVVGDLMSVPGVPGQAQGAIQGAVYATKQIKAELKGDDLATRKPFKYFDKGSMATVSRFSAVCQIGKLEFGGFLAWLAWLGLHLYYLVGGRNRLMAVISWFVTFLGRGRGQMAITERWVFARRALEQSREQSAQKSIG
jgi:NADH:ubiquinone reductase (H+-translocating)